MSTLPPGWLVQQLPRVLREDALTTQLVGALEEMAAEARAPLDDLEHLVDVDLAPASFVRWLAAWIGVPVEEGLPERRQREVVRTAGRQFPWRGTRRGLRELIEAYTGQPVEVEDTGGVTTLDEVGPDGGQRQVTIHVHGAGGIDEHHLLRLVEQEIPADATVELRIEDQAVESEATPGQLTDEGEDGGAPEAAGPGPMAPRQAPPPPPTPITDEELEALPPPGAPPMRPGPPGPPASDDGREQPRSSGPEDSQEDPQEDPPDAPPPPPTPDG